MKLSPSHMKLWKAIKKILWEDWDPIGLNASPGSPEDEYDGYVNQIFQLKIQGSTKEDIVKQLLKDEEYILGMPGNLSHCHEIAKKIAAIKL